MKKTSYEISYAVITSIGERKTNEDAYGILELPDKKYFLVCDGLGGHGDDVPPKCQTFQAQQFDGCYAVIMQPRG